MAFRTALYKYSSFSFFVSYHATVDMRYRCGVMFHVAMTGACLYMPLNDVVYAVFGLTELCRVLCLFVNITNQGHDKQLYYFCSDRTFCRRMVCRDIA